MESSIAVFLTGRAASEPPPTMEGYSRRGGVRAAAWQCQPCCRRLQVPVAARAGMAVALHTWVSH